MQVAKRICESIHRCGSGKPQRVIREDECDGFNKTGNVTWKTSVTIADSKVARFPTRDAWASIVSVADGGQTAGGAIISSTSESVRTCCGIIAKSAHRDLRYTCCKY